MGGGKGGGGGFFLHLRHGAQKVSSYSTSIRQEGSSAVPVGGLGGGDTHVSPRAENALMLSFSLAALQGRRCILSYDRTCASYHSKK